LSAAFQERTVAQRTQIVAELKRALRARGLTYAHVAKHLQLSEASVKRLFACIAWIRPIA